MVSETDALNASSLDLVAGEVVEVRSKEEILATLDADGMTDGMPFMPEMLAFCGQRVTVDKRADKTCDTIYKSGGRRLFDTVHLADLRCDGKAHGGCEAACLLFWKEAWLKRIGPKPIQARLTRLVQFQGAPTRPGPNTSPVAAQPDEAFASTVLRPGEDPAASDPAYRCQVTELYDASHELHWYDPRQYLRDLVSGNVGPLRMLRVALFSAFRNLVHLGYGYRLLTGTYDRIRRAMGKTPWPIRQGQCKRTPSEKLDLQPGEWVEVKSYDEILATLDPRNKNRGLYFDPEMTLFCGKRYRVAARVKKILDEKTGRMVHFPNECIILHNAVCVADYSQERLFCPRAIYPYWREIWLKRVEST